MSKTAFESSLLYYIEDEFSKKSLVAKIAVLECPGAYFINLDVIDRIHTVEMKRYKQRDGCHGKSMATSGVHLIVETCIPSNLLITTSSLIVNINSFKLFF